MSVLDVAVGSKDQSKEMHLFKIGLRVGSEGEGVEVE